MYRRCALIVEKDKSFANRLQRCLRAAGVDADIVDSRRAALDRMAEEPPAILFLAVEQPKRAGFALFSDIKRLARQTPVVLVTSTVPKAEMLLHQKLRIHADAYLDKRELDETAILDAVSRLLSLDLDAREVRLITRDARATPARSTSLEPALATLLAELGADPAELEAETDRSFDAEPDAEDAGRDHDPEVQDQLESLERKLEVARQSARSSPFSGDYLALADRADVAERSVAGVRRELDARTRQVEQQRASLIQAASRLLDAERERRDATDRIRALEAQHGAVQDELRRAHESLAALESAVVAERQRAEDQAGSQASTLATLRQEIADVQLGAADAALAADARHTEEKAALERRHAQILTGERERLQREHEASRKDLAAELRRRGAEAIQEHDAEWRRRMDELQREHDSLAALESAVVAQRQRAEEQARSQASTLGTLQQELADVQLRAAEAALAAEARHTEEKAALERRYAQALAGERERLQREHEERGAEWQRRIEELQREHASLEALESGVAAERQRAEEQARSQASLLASLQQELADLQLRAAEATLDTEARHTEEKAALERHHAQALAGERQRVEEQARSQASTLATLQQELADVQLRAAEAALDAEARHTEEKAALERRYAQALAAERERLQREHEARAAEWQRRIEELQREHARAVEHQRGEHRRELTELQDSLEKALERKERQTATELLAIADEHEQKLERATEDWRARLAQAEQSLRSESRQASTSQELRIEELERRHSEAVGALRAQLAAESEQALAAQALRHDETLTQTVEKLRSELIRESNRRLDEVEQSERRHRAEIVAQEQRYREEIELLNQLREVGNEPRATEQEDALAAAPCPGSDEVKQAIEALDAESRSPIPPPATPARTDDVIRRSRNPRRSR